MNTVEFIEYMESVLTSKQSFYLKAMADQDERNKRRQPAKRWNETKQERLVDKQWKELMTNVYNKVKMQQGSALKESWVEFINQEGFLESLDESIIEIEFE